MYLNMRLNFVRLGNLTPKEQRLHGEINQLNKSENTNVKNVVE